MKTAFVDNERIGRIGPEEVQAYLLRLAREKGYLETIFNALHEGVIVTDATGRINFLNDAACGLFGLDREVCLTQPLAAHLPGLDWESLVATEQVISRDMEVFYPQNRFINFYVVPLSLERPLKRGRKTGGDELVGYAVILRDITESRRSAAETIESERITALTLLAAGVAHEIGNPLNSLHIHLQLMERRARKLADEGARKELGESIRVARDEIQRLDYIVTQFLRAIRPQPLEVQPESLNALVQESIAFLAAEIKDRDIIVEQELRPDLPLLHLDRQQIKQALYNVIKNAFQAMKSSGILHLKTDMDDQWVSVSFTDTGGGIAREQMSRIFEPYFTTKPSGTGLGLLIVRRIVRTHGGEIDIVNKEGQGMTLTIRLPIHDRRVRMLPAGGEGGMMEG